MNSYIKIKALSLGAEIKLIRREERRWLKRSRRNALRLKGRTNQPEITIEQRNHALANFWGLRGHRLSLRSDARVANLAYGFLRGRTYKQVENRSYRPPNWDGMVRLLERYGENVGPRDDIKNHIEAWYKKE